MPTILNIEKSNIKPNHTETARYLGYSKLSTPDSEISSLIQNAASQMHQIIVPKATYESFDLEIIKPQDDNSKASIKILGTKTLIKSKDLYNNLLNCHKVYLIACTLGPQVDSLIRKTQITNPVLASIFQATGAMYIEEVVDFVNNRIKEIEEKSNCTTKPRFSPGFGDVSLEIQKTFFNLLPCTKIGLTLMNTLIMAPEKSVTAFIGVQ